MKVYYKFDFSDLTNQKQDLLQLGMRKQYFCFVNYEIIL